MVVESLIELLKKYERDGLYEILYLTRDSKFSYTAIVESGGRKFILKVVESGDLVGFSSLVDLLVLSIVHNATPIVITPMVGGRVLSEGVAYERAGVWFVSFATFIRSLRGEMPKCVLKRGRCVGEVEGEVFRRKRLEMDLSLKDVAELVGVSRKAVYEYERGSMEVTEKVARRLEEVFGPEVLRRVNIFDIPHESAARMSFVVAKRGDRARRFRKYVEEVVGRIDVMYSLERAHAIATGSTIGGCKIMVAKHRTADVVEVAQSLNSELVVTNLQNNL